MRRALYPRRLLHKAVPSILLVLAMALVLGGAPPASAHSHLAAVTTTSIGYRLDGQLVGGPSVGTALLGWLSGTKDSTGVVTATLTIADAATNAPVTSDVSGRIVGSGSSAAVVLVVTGKGSSWVLAGSGVGKIGQWAGSITRGSAHAGSWMLTPTTTSYNIDAGGKSAAKSKDKVTLSGTINVNVTATGWAVGTYASFDGTMNVMVAGHVNNGDIVVTIPMGKMGTMALIGTARTVIAHPGWNGNFIGPAPGDYGTWIGRG